LHPEYVTPFWTNVRPVCGKCKLSLWRVYILWICEFNENNFLLVTTKSNKENIYYKWWQICPLCSNQGHTIQCVLLVGHAFKPISPLTRANLNFWIQWLGLSFCVPPIPLYAFMAWTDQLYHYWTHANQYVQYVAI